MGFIVGLVQGEAHEYTVNDVKYIVDSRFAKPEKVGEGENLRDRITSAIQSDFVPLSLDDLCGTMADEYACSDCVAQDSAGKED